MKTALKSGKPKPARGSCPYCGVEKASVRHKACRSCQHTQDLFSYKVHNSDSELAKKAKKVIWADLECMKSFMQHCVNVDVLKDGPGGPGARVLRVTLEDFQLDSFMQDSNDFKHQWERHEAMAKRWRECQGEPGELAAEAAAEHNFKRICQPYQV